MKPLYLLCRPSDAEPCDVVDAFDILGVFVTETLLVNTKAENPNSFVITHPVDEDVVPGDVVYICGELFGLFGDGMKFTMITNNVDRAKSTMTTPDSFYAPLVLDSLEYVNRNPNLEWEGAVLNR